MDLENIILSEVTQVQKDKYHMLLWDNSMYPVTCILKVHWLTSSQEGSVGRENSQEVEVGPGEEENFGKRKESVCSGHPDTEEARHNKQNVTWCDVTEKGTKSHG